MTNKHKDLLLWAHSLAEYQHMFDLNERDLSKKLLDCASGLSSFNAELAAQNKFALSCDKAYGLSPSEMATHVEQVLLKMYQHVKEADKANPDRFIWQDNISPEKLLEKRTKQAQRFLQDYPLGLQQGRYVYAELPQLPFSNNQFDLAVCSHLLFANNALSLEFHVQAIAEMCRVAGEVRIFPLLDWQGKVSMLVAPLLVALQMQNMSAEIRQVKYEFQRGGNAMLRVWAQTCQV
ncbi:MAG: class I SAM-dependent methyltransferase [Gammaproteobacteria bacterium]